jgi:hypothetical protein
LGLTKDLGTTACELIAAINKIQYGGKTNLVNCAGETLHLDVKRKITKINLTGMD